MAKGGVKRPGVRHLLTAPYKLSGTKAYKLSSTKESINFHNLNKIVIRATEIFGSREEAVQWLERPALGLDQQRPIDLLQTPAGIKLVEDFLGRLEYGVYT